MTGRAYYRPVARLDLIQAANHYREIGPELAERFQTAVEETVEQLAGMPGLGSPYEHQVSGMSHIRFFIVRDFPKYIIFYREFGDGILVVRIQHGSRNLIALLTGQDP
jgi:plasmid stabilization system protein ParE